MLEALCGNRNIQRILIFLFVNGKCYGTQLHRALHSPLTPLQKALNRLERGGIILSHYEGKTRLYQFNPAYPLLNELEQLLKKSYTLLPAQEKKEYYVVKEELISNPTQENKIKTLMAFWEKLLSVSQLTYHAKTRSEEEIGWNGKGQGEVIITREKDYTVLFNEKGTWQSKMGAECSFSNTFRWRLDRYAGVVSLEHLRRGFDHPVFLFHLAPSGKQTLTSVDSHLCDGDTYFGQIHFDRQILRLNWRVIGPKKNEEIDYYYT